MKKPFHTGFFRLLVLICLLVFGSGCGAMMTGVEKMVDPYSRKYKCPNPQGFDCIDLDASYDKDREIQSEKDGEPKTNLLDENREIHDIGYGLNTDFPNELLEAADGNETASAAEMLIQHIREQKNFPQIEGELLERIADDYRDCLKAARKKSKKESLSDEAAVEALHACSGILADIPGMVTYKSAEISEKIRLQRETEAMKIISRSLGPGATPIRVPAGQIRIFVVPYVDDRDVFNQGHYLYTTVGEGKWIISDDDDDPNPVMRMLEQ